MEATTALHHIKESRGKSHARTHSGTRIIDAEEDSPSPTSSLGHRISRHITLSSASDDERREGKKEKKDGKKEKKDKKKKEKKDKKEKDKDDRKSVSLSLKAAATSPMGKLPSPRKRTNTTKEAKEAGKTSKDQQAEKEIHSVGLSTEAEPAPRVQIATPSTPPKLTPMEVEMDFALKAFSAGQDPDETIKEVAIDDLGATPGERTARVLLRRSLSGNIPSGTYNTAPLVGAPP
jgi:hypothetical protein